MIGAVLSTANTFAPISEIEFWFDFGSNYSYLSVMRIDAQAASHGVRILWRPFLLGPVFRDLGFDNSPFVLQQKKGAYVWKDMERQCRGTVSRSHVPLSSHVPRCWRCAWRY